MTLREILGLGTLLLLFVLLGVVWYSITLHPEKYRRRRTWLCLTACIFVLYSICILLVVGRSDLEGILQAIVFGLFGSILTAIALWIPMREKEWIRERLGSRHKRDETKKQD